MAANPPSTARTSATAPRRAVAPALGLLAAVVAGTASAGLAQRPAEAPRTAGAAPALAALSWSDGPAVVAALEGFVAGLELPIRARFGLGLARAALSTASGGRDLGKLAGLLSPGAGQFGVVRVGGVPQPFLRIAVGGPDPERDALLARLGVPVVRRAEGWWTLAADPVAAESAGALPPPPPIAPGTLRLTADLAALRGLTGRLDRGVDPAGVWLASPWLAVLETAGRAAGEVRIGRGSLRVDVEFDAVAAADPRAAVTLPDVDAAAIPPAPRGTVATLRPWRSLRRFLAARDVALTPGEAAQIGGGLAIADALCAGSFVDDVLGALREPVALFAVAREVPAPDQPDTAAVLDLPSFVLVAPLAEPASAAEVERRFAHTLGLFLTAASAERARNRQHPFRMRVHTVDAVRYHVIEPHEYLGPLPPPIDVTFSPTLVVTAGHAVLATTRDGAERAVAALGGDAAPPVAGDRLSVDAAGIATWIDRNRERLVLDEILKTGSPVRTATQAIEDRRGVVAAFGRLDVSIAGGAASTLLSIELTAAREEVR